MIGPTGADRSHLTLFWVSSALTMAMLPGATFADIEFDESPAFAAPPQVIFGEGSPSVIPSPPEGLDAIPNGFRYTDVVITYSTGAGDAGNQVLLGWGAGRAFTVVGNPFNGVTKAAIGGTISPGAQSQDVTFLRNTTEVLDVAGSTSIATDGTPYLGPPVGTFGDGPNTSNQFGLAVGVNGVLTQAFLIQIAVPPGTPAGTTYTFSFPGSVDSSIFSESGIPTVSEWGLIIMTLLALTAGTIIFGRRRRSAVA